MASTAVMVFFCIHLMIALLMMSIGTIYHIDNIQYAGLTRQDINSVPSLTIAVGILMMIFMIGSCLMRNMYDTEGYIMMSLLLLMIQLAAAVHGCFKVSDKNGILNATLQADMKSDISLFFKHDDIRYIRHLILVQEKFKCCGVDGPLNYNKTRLPASCCPDQKPHSTYCANKNTSYSNGCASIVYDQVFHNTGIVAYVAIVLSITQVLGTLFITAKLTGIDQQFNQGPINYHNF